MAIKFNKVIGWWFTYIDLFAFIHWDTFTWTTHLFAFDLFDYWPQKETTSENKIIFLRSNVIRFCV